MTRTVFGASSSIGGHTTALPRGGGWRPPRREKSQTAATTKKDELAASGPDWHTLRPTKLTHAERILVQDPQNGLSECCVPLRDGARHPEMGSHVPAEQRLQGVEPLRKG